MSFAEDGKCAPDSGGRLKAVLPLRGTLLAGLMLATVMAVGAEAGAGLRGHGARLAGYAGGAGGMLSVLSGLPFLLRMVRSAAREGGNFWLHWGLGLSARTLTGLGAALAVQAAFPAECGAALVVLALVYFTALMLETAWAALLLARATNETNETHRATGR